MREHGIRGYVKKRKVRTTIPEPADQVVPDLLKRDFTAEAPNRRYVDDITYLPLSAAAGGGNLYLATMIDCYSRRLVGWAIADHMRTELVEDALKAAAATRGSLAGAIFHSDHGSVRSRKFVRALNRHDLVGSMGRVAAAGDNAAMESFFALLQKNVLDRRAWATRDELRIAIVTWIERTYHHRRRQARLGRLTPVEYETIMTTPATQAA